MRRVVRPMLVPLIAPVLIAAQPGAPLPGFTAESARVEREWETKFRANADWRRDRLASRGWAAELEPLAGAR
jgi:hypothetical protein